MSTFPGDPAAGFLLEEYKNIAATHDKLRDMLVRLFNYSLLLSAFPFTVAGFMFRDGTFDLLAAPVGLHLLFFTVGLGQLFLTLSLIDARLSQYRYAKTVNAIRRYFADNYKNIVDYLYLPTTTDVPSWEDLGYIKYQIRFMTLVGATFTAYGSYGALSSQGSLGRCWSVVAALAMLATYVVAYKLFRTVILRRYQKHRGGIK